MRLLPATVDLVDKIGEQQRPDHARSDDDCRCRGRHAGGVTVEGWKEEERGNFEYSSCFSFSVTVLYRCESIGEMTIGQPSVLRL